MSSSQTDHIEIESSGTSSSIISVTSYQAIELLTYFKDQGITASGQKPTIFGDESIPSIYTIEFSISVSDVLQKIKDYLKQKDLLFEVEEKSNQDKKVVKITIHMQSH